MEALDEDEQEEELLRMEACLDEQELEEERVEQVHQARATAGGAAVSVSQTTRSSSGLELDENEYGEMYPSEDEQGFVEQWKRRLNSDDGLMASLWSMMLSVTGGVESAAFFKSLGGGHCKQSVCGKVWKRGSIAYRCLVCEVDPNSCTEANLDVQYMMALSQGTPMTYYYEVDEEVRPRAARGT